MSWLYEDSLYTKIGSKEELRGATRSDGSLDLDEFLLQAIKFLSKDLERTVYDQNEKRQKDNEKSARFREEGNDFLKKSNGDAVSLENALRAYTKSIAYAVPNSREIALSYANRSTVLLKLKRPNECLDDIDRAFNSGYPDDLKPKVLIRLAECCSKLATESYIEAKSWLSKVPINDNNLQAFKAILKPYPSSVVDKGPFTDEECVIPKLKSPSEKFPCASSAIDVKYSETFGRHIVAQRDIKVGEILVVEKPQLQYLDDELRYTHCFHCMGYAWGGIPCEQCVNAVFCSQKCKSEAWDEYHEAECTVLDVTLQYKMFFATIRLIIKMTKEAGGLSKLKERVEAFHKFNAMNKGQIRKKWYQKPCLESILTLQSNIDKIPVAYLRMQTVVNICTMFIMATCSDIFGVQYDREEMYDIDVLSAMANDPDVLFFCRLFNNVSFAIKLSCIVSIEESQNDQISRGRLTLPFTSFFNHSCFANSVMQFKRTHTVTYAALPIKKGEQVFTTYSLLSCYGNSKKKREQALKMRYHFTCHCRACDENWSEFNDTYTAIYKMDLTSGTLQGKFVKSYNLSSEIGTKIRNGDLRDKDNMLEELYKIVQLFHENSNTRLNISILRTLLYVINKAYRITGNVSKLHLKFPLQ